MVLSAVLPGAPLANSISGHGFQLGVDGGDAARRFLPTLGVFTAADRSREIGLFIGSPACDHLVLHGVSKANQSLAEELALFGNVFLDGIEIGQHQRKRKRDRRYVDDDLVEHLLEFGFGGFPGGALRESRFGISDFAPVDAEAWCFLQMNGFIAYASRNTNRFDVGFRYAVE